MSLSSGKGVRIPGDTGDSNTFLRNVKYRLASTGLGAIRDMRMSEPVFEVKVPQPSINPHNFKYIHNPSAICSSQPHLSFLIYIHSAPGNLKRRQIIRQTWGNLHLLSLFNASLVFALGSPDQQNVQKMLDMEFEQYGDLLQEDYQDAYRNLTFKGMSVLKWATQHCRQPLFFFKTDDDILLDVVSVIQHILMKTVPARGAKNLVLCNLWTTMKVIRDPKSKWGLTKEEFAPDVFPPYCSGSAFFMSGDMLPRMYSTALRSKFFWVDDYYISGALVNALGVKHERYNQAYLLNGLQVEEKLVNDTKMFTVVHIKKYSLFFKAWRLLMKRHSGLASYLHLYSVLNTPDLKNNFFQKQSFYSSSFLSSNFSSSFSSPSFTAAVSPSSSDSHPMLASKPQSLALQPKPLDLKQKQPTTRKPQSITLKPQFQSLKPQLSNFNPQPKIVNGAKVQLTHFNSTKEKPPNLPRVDLAASGG